MSFHTQPTLCSAAMQINQANKILKVVRPLSRPGSTKYDAVGYLCFIGADATGRRLVNCALNTPVSSLMSEVQLYEHFGEEHKIGL
jgi:hypothetical protein